MALSIITRNVRINSNLFRYFHTTPHNAKIDRTMRKVMGLAAKKKRKYFDTPVLTKPSDFSKGSYEGIRSVNSKRTTVLNKLFMRHITDLMATGENCEEYLGNGIEIHRVQITPDFQCVNVFWIAKGTEKDEVVQEILDRNAGYLRHELSTLKVMGMVPAIKFLKDKQNAQIMEVDLRLAKADFGEDYEPTETATKLKAHLQLITPLDNAIKEKIKKLDVENEEEDDEPLPPMPQDVFGLNHAQILIKIQKSMKKSEASHRFNSDDAEITFTRTINENPIEYFGGKEKREAFKEFLQKRERLRRKATKENKNYSPDLEYLQDEFKKRQDAFYENLDLYDTVQEDADYFSDDEFK